MASKLTMDTLIPISLVGFIAMGAAWIANVQASTIENTKSIQDIVQRRDQQHDTISIQLSEMNAKLSRIEGFIQSINDKERKHE